MQKEIFENVCQVIEDSAGIPASEISRESTLFDELHLDSIDFVDILFELETQYDIQIKASAFEEKAREELGDLPFEVDEIITKEGLAEIKKYMPEVDQSQLVEGLSVMGLIKLITVQSICNVIEYKLSKKA